MKNRPDAEEERRTFTEIDPYAEYEREKAKLRKLDLPYAEFQRRLREIAEELGI